MGLPHSCHANECSVATEPRMFMCLKHWKMVPAHKQAAVWKAYREAPKPGRARNRAYLTACADAVEHVAVQEGKNGRNSYRNILNMPNGPTS